MSQPDPRPTPEADTLDLPRRAVEIAHRLVSLTGVELEGALRESLSAGSLVGAERVWLCLPSGSGEITDLEWSAPGRPSWPGLASTLAERSFPWSEAVYRRGEVLHIPSLAELPAEAREERASLVERGVRSLVTVPITAGPRQLGFLSCETYSRERRWSEPEIVWLRLLGELVAAAWERARAERTGRETEGRFRAFAEHAPELVSVFDSEGRYLYANPSFEELLGWPPESLVGEIGEKLIHPEDRASSRVSFRGAVDRDVPVKRQLHRLRHRDGSWRWFDNTGRAFLTQDGVQRFVSIGRDVTEHRAVEEALRESQRQLFQSQKMEAVGRLAGGIAHDFNNLLTVMGGNAEFLLDHRELPSSLREDLREIRRAVERAAELTRQLLSFGRRSRFEPTILALPGLVRGLQGMFRRVLGSDVRLVLEAGEPALVEADAGRLEQVLLNLVVNARDAMPDGGELRIAVERVEVGEDEATRRNLQPGPHVRLSVSDSGAGMDEATRERIFEPFFTTKDPDRGSGLGLSIVYTAVRECGGSIAVQSEPGTGTRFEIHLPGAQQARGRTSPRVAERTPRGSGTVLLVEDDASVRRLMKRDLETAGYAVVEAADGLEALERLDTLEGRIDLVLSDVVMPRLGGSQLARQLRRDRPDLPILLVCGHPERASAAAEPLDVPLVEKPIARSDLLARVRAMIAGI